MSDTLHIFWADLKRIAKNPFTLIVAFGVALIPCLYSWLNIYANLDPYSHTEDIAVAVVNQDLGTTVDGKAENAGNLIVSAMKAEPRLKWTFVDEATATEGLKSGKFYAAYIIGPNFSSDIAGVLDGKSTKASLRYLVNEKLNPIAPKVSDTAASTLEAEISANFNQLVSKTLAEKFQLKAQDLSQKFDSQKSSAKESLYAASTELKDLSDKLNNKSEDIKKNQAKLLELKSQLQGANAAAKERGQALADSLSQLPKIHNDVADFNLTLMQNLNKKAAQLSRLSSDSQSKLIGLQNKNHAAYEEVTGALGQAQSALDEAKALSDQLDTVLTTIDDLPISETEKEQLKTKVQNLKSTLAAENSSQQQKLDALSQTSFDINAALTANMQLGLDVAGLIQNSSNATSELFSDYATNLFPKLAATSDAIAGTSSQMSAANLQLNAAIETSLANFDSLSASLGELSSQLKGTADSLSSLSGELSGLASDLSLLQTPTILKELSSITPEAASTIAANYKEPVSLVHEALFPTPNYGTGIAAFFTNVSIWVECIALIVIFKLEDFGQTNPRPSFYFGRYLALSTIAAAQALFCSIGNLLIGINCANPVAYMLSSILIALIFCQIVYALASSLKHIGRALAFLLLVVQVPGSSGIYPVEMMDQSLSYLTKLLPFTYANQLLRECISGFYAQNYLINLTVLCLFATAFCALALSIKGRHLQIASFFDAKLASAEIFNAEYLAGLPFSLNKQQKLSTLTLTEDSLAQKISRLQSHKRALKRLSFIAIFSLPLCCLVIFYLLNLKLIGLIVAAAVVAALVALQFIGIYYLELSQEKLRFIQTERDSWTKALLTHHTKEEN